MNPATRKSSKRSLSVFDGVFIGLITLALAAGIQLSKVEDEHTPFAPSVLFGSAISLLTYYFLGGINKDEASIETNLGNAARITLGGSIGALVGTTLISNFILERQMTNILDKQIAILEMQMAEIDLSYEPLKQELMILDQDGELIEELKILGRVGSISEKNLPITVSHNLAEKVKKACHNGEGFCDPGPPENVTFNVNERLIEGYATVCQKHKWHSYPLILTSKSGRRAIRVTAVANNFCHDNDDHSNITISDEDAQKLGIGENDEGFANIPALTAGFSPNIYETFQ